MRTGWAAPLLLLPCLAGCEGDPDTTYGTVRGDSLNGVSAFVQVLRDSGRTTATRRGLGERMIGRHDVAVVIADTAPAPNDESREFLVRFLAAPGDQTLVYVVRNSDAAIDYWRAVVAFPGLAADKMQTAQANLADTERLLAVRAGSPLAAGSEPLAYGLAARSEPLTVPVEVRLGRAAATVSANWPRFRRLDPPAQARPVWTAEGEPVLVEQVVTTPATWNDDPDAEPDSDRTLILASAAPLLNGGLVDPGNRRLAGELAALLPAACRVIVVGSTRVQTAQEEREAQGGMWRLLTVQPNPWVAAQGLLAMVLFCWWRAPIFGRPRRETVGRPQDFSHHVTALAALLRRARDESFVQRRLDAWRRPGETTTPAGQAPAPGP